MGIKALPSPEDFSSLQVTANEEVFMSKLWTGGKENPLARKPQGEWEQQVLSSSGLT